MSMIARFAEVPAASFPDLLANPKTVNVLFQDLLSQPLPKPIVNIQGARSLPQMLAAALGRLPPNVQRALTERLSARGIEIKDLQAGRGTEQLLDLLRSGLGKPNADALGGMNGAMRTVGGARISLDKAWHGVHYLLSGSARPGATLISHAILGGTEIGDDDMGYGPARYFAPPDALAVADALSVPGIENAMQARFDPPAMVSLEIYPGGWSNGDLAWLMDEYRRLREFFEQATSRNSAVFTCLV